MEPTPQQLRYQKHYEITGGRKEYSRKNYLANKETKKEKQRQSFLNNKAKVYATRNAWRKANKQALKISEVLGISLAEARQKLSNG